MVKMSVLAWIATWLVIIGGINWGLVGIFDFNLVTWLAELVMFPMLETIIYVLVGLSAFVSAILLISED